MELLSLSHHEGEARPARGDTLARLRRQMAVISGTPEGSSAEPASVEAMPMPEEFAEVLGTGGLVRGTVVSYTGARSLLIALVAAVTAGGSQVGIVGLPGLNLAAAAEMGADLERIAVIADPGVDPVEVASVLLDGMDLVVLGLRGLSIPPSRCRVVGGRVRQQSSSLLAVDGAWPGAHTQLSARVLGYRHRPALTGMADLAGARSGHGHLAGMRLQVVSQRRDRRRRDSEIEFVAGDFGDRAVRMKRAGSGYGADVAVAN